MVVNFYKYQVGATMSGSTNQGPFMKGHSLDPANKFFSKQKP